MKSFAVFEKLYIQNFQAHTKTKIEFDPGVTTIIGPSDVGKSAVLRALRWLCLNAPQGSAFIRHQTPGTAIKLIVDGQLITRKRTANENLYAINQEPPFKSFGFGVPEPIVSLLHVSDLNFQQQHDAPFWLSLSPAEVARQLNAIVNLSEIDRALAHSSKCVRDTAKETEVCLKRLKTARQDRDALEWVQEAELEWQTVCEKYTAAANAFNAAAQLEQSLAKARAAVQMRDNARTKASAGRRVLQIARKVKQQSENIQGLQKHIRRIQRGQQLLTHRWPSFDNVRTAAEKCIQQKKEIKDLKCRVQRIISYQERRQQDCERLKVLQQRFADMHPALCPMCGKEIP